MRSDDAVEQGVGKRQGGVVHQARQRQALGRPHLDALRRRHGRNPAALAGFGQQRRGVSKPKHVKAGNIAPGLDDLQVDQSGGLAAERVGRTSVTYAWQAIRDGQVCVEGRTVTVHVDGDGAPAPLPQPLRELAV